MLIFNVDPQDMKKENYNIYQCLIQATESSEFKQ